MSLETGDVRRIKFSRSETKWSNDPTLDLVMAGNTPIPTVTAKTTEINIPTADGVINTSRASGRLRFDKVTIPYVFTHEISRYDEYGNYRTINTMNQLCADHVSAVKEWAYQPEAYDYNPQGNKLVLRNSSRLYDTGLCDPTAQTGYWFPNPNCTAFSNTKVLSADKWIIQYQITITVDPYMYEYTADPRTFAVYSGPTTQGAGEGNVRVRIYTKSRGILTPTDNSTVDRYLWTNDNVQWLPSSSAGTPGINADAWARWSFKPSVAPIYKGPIGLYMNFYVDYTYNDVPYQYHVSTMASTSGTCDFISSEKIVTQHEMVLTDHNGCELYANIVNTGDHPIGDLITATNGHIPIPFTWGVAKHFITNDVHLQYMVTGFGPATSFNKVGRQDPIDFGDAFTLDNDGYNELQMNSSDYGVYRLESPDNARRRV